MKYYTKDPSFCISLRIIGNYLKCMFASNIDYIEWPTLYIVLYKTYLYSKYLLTCSYDYICISGLPYPQSVTCWHKPQLPLIWGLNPGSLEYKIWCLCLRWWLGVDSPVTLGGNQEVAFWKYPSVLFGFTYSALFLDSQPRSHSLSVSNSTLLFDTQLLRV